MMRLLFQDGPLNGLDIPWFQDEKPGCVMQFPLCTTTPPTKCFYKVTEDFNQGRRVMVPANYKDLMQFRLSACDEVIRDIAKYLKKLRHDVVWHIVGFVGCIACTVLNLVEAYRGEWLPILWQIPYSFFIVFTGWRIKISVLKRRKLRYALDGMKKLRATENPSRTDMLVDQVIAALADSKRVGIPTINKLKL